MILILDAYNLAYASYHALHDKLRGASGNEAALYGILKTLISRLENSPLLQHVFVVFDNAEQKSWRHREFPEYKANRNVFRNEKDEREKKAIRSSVNYAISELKTLCEYLPVYTIERRNTEADDLVAWLVHKYSEKHVSSQIVSGDKDMWQLIGPYVTVFRPSTGIDINMGNFAQVCAVKANKTERITIHQPVDWLFFRILSGDTSDNIPPVPGFGEITAARAISSARELMMEGGDENHLCAGDYLMNNPTKVMTNGHVRGWKKLVERLQNPEVHRVIARNTRLMNMLAGSHTMQQLLNAPLPESCIRKGRYDRDRFWAWLEARKFNTVMMKFPLFDGLFVATGG